MSIKRTFSMALAGLGLSTATRRRPLPSRLAAACTAVLPVDGAAICLLDPAGIRVPAGVSDHDAATAERLEFTAGQGPGLDAHTAGCTVIATETLIAQEWPMYYHCLVEHTRFRAITAVPLPGALLGLGTLELYFRRPHGIADLDMIDTDHIATQITDLLTQNGAADPTPRPGWSDTPDAAGRTAVITAIELLGTTLTLSGYDALTLLRARAYATDRTVDALAADILRHRIPIDQFCPDPPTT